MSILHAPAALSTVDASDLAWSDRFDKAQKAFRERNRRPVAEAPAVESDAEFFERFGAELDAVEARGGLLTKLVPAESFADQLVTAVACTECRDDRDIPVPLDDPAWDEVWTTDEPAFTDDDLLRGVPHYGIDGPQTPATTDAVDRAWHNGYCLGESGFEVRDLNPPAHYTGREADAFIRGVEVGANERWTAYGQWLDEQDAMGRMMDDDREEREYAEARMIQMAVMA